MERGVPFIVLLAILLGILNEVFSQSCPGGPAIANKKIQQGTAEKLETWTGGFKGSMSFSVPEDINGWNIKLAFTGYVNTLEIWRAQPDQTQGSEFYLTNMNWNKVLSNGDTLDMTFIARFSGDDIDICTPYLLWEDDGVTVTESTTTTTLSASITTTTLSTSSTTTDSSLCSSADYNYAEVLEKSILFYEAQRSGTLPSNNRIDWRGDSALGDQGENNEDLTGGWYDAGDHVKFGFPMAFSTTLLCWGLLEYKDAYSNAGQLNIMLDSIRWPLDYFIKAHVQEKVLYGQVGNGGTDHAYWGRPEEMTMTRPAYKIDTNNPGSDLAAETAAAMAVGSIVFRESDSQYADVLLNRAKQLYQFADQYQGKYSDSITDANSYYPSQNYNDELAWGAAWLYRATQDQQYLQKAEDYFTQFSLGGTAWGFSWAEKTAGVQMLLYQLTGQSTYQTAIQNSLNAWLPGGSVTYTPKGLAWRIQWGSNRYAANTAFLALLAADKGLSTTTYRNFGEKQIDYMLGDSGRSFVVGFGNNPPQSPHHSSSSCPDQPSTCDWNNYNSPAPNPQVLNGALVGGPDQNDNYADVRSDYVKNEVACDYNAGFQSAIAALISNKCSN